MNYLVTYPRSGTNWTLNRIKALLEVDQNLKKLAKNCYVRHSHLGFRPGGALNGEKPSITIDAKARMFIQLRDARKVLVSNWYFIKSSEQIYKKRSNEWPDMFSNIESHLRSSYAVDRFCQFLKRVKEFKNVAQARNFYYYEDIHSHQFIYEIPKILGVDYEVTNEIAAKAHERGNYPDVQFGTDHSALSKETAEYIQSQLRERCVLEEYSERYL